MLYGILKVLLIPSCDHLVHTSYRNLDRTDNRLGDSALSPQPNKEQEMRRRSHIPLHVRCQCHITLMYILSHHIDTNPVDCLLGILLRERVVVSPVDSYNHTMDDQHYDVLGRREK